MTRTVQTGVSSLRRRVALLVLVAATLLALDQGTKAWTRSELRLASDPVDLQKYDSRTVAIVDLGSAEGGGADASWASLSLRYVQNPGIGFSLFAGLAPGIRVSALSGLAVVALAVFLVMMQRLPPAAWTAQIGLVMVATGAFGNLVDRLRLGFVIDMVAASWRISGWQVAFPVFNVADIWITLGVPLLVLGRGRP